MREVFIVSDNVVSPLGNTSADNFINLKKNRSGIKHRVDPVLSQEPVYVSLIDEAMLPVTGTGNRSFTKFEKLLIASVRDAISGINGIAGDEKTILIVSSTKGNISLAEGATVTKELQQRISLSHSAGLVAAHFGFVNRPVVVSHACISGLVAIITGMRLIRSGQYDTAVVTGADVITKFILSGFQSFQAISHEPCKPFDESRNGITLGEGAATVVLSVNKPAGETVKVSGGAVSNDANHISGPSRTGEELYQAIQAALKESGLSQKDIDFISAHGTATVYNDEMEAKAIHLAGMEAVPMNSLKGYYGHTLGAAGLIETVISVHSLKENVVLPTPGFTKPGTSMPVKVSNVLREEIVHNCLKTASGFGGCNAAIVLQKTGYL